jgi:CubicO group peptidase (beta-lactamase class C family)
MTINFKQGLIGLSVLLLLWTGGYALNIAAMVGSGVVAKRVCSEIWVAGRDPGQDFGVEKSVVWVPVGHRVDEISRTVTARTVGMGKQVAVWREGLGCALVLSRTVEAVTAQALEGHAPLVKGVEPRPAGENISDAPSPEEIDLTGLRKALDWAFEEDNHPGPVHTRAVVVLHRGRLIYERYAKGFGPETPMLGWSATKSVNHALVGAAIHRNILDINEPVGFQEWAGDRRKEITLDHLLRMSSGLDAGESLSPWGKTDTMLFRHADMAKMAAGIPLKHVPGTRWEYSTTTSLLIQRALREAIGDDNAYHRFPRQALFDPIGARSAVLEADASGTFVGSSYLYMTARDWARFGLLYSRDGVWEGKRVLPQGWAAHGCTPSQTAPEGKYGAHWWTNGGADKETEDRPFPGLPGDLCWAWGFEQNQLVLAPSRDLVVVRLGVTRKFDDFDLETFYRGILRALPEIG